MSEIYRFTTLRRRGRADGDAVELPPPGHVVLRPAGDSPPWALSRVPGHEVLRQLAVTTEPLTTAAVVRPLVESFAIRPGADVDAMRDQLRTAFTGPDAVRLRTGVGSVTRLALAARPSPVADLVLLARCVVALRTAEEWAAGMRADDEWQAGIERPMLRPAPPPQSPPAGAPSTPAEPTSLARRLRSRFRRRPPRPVADPAPMATRRRAPRTTPSAGPSWQEIAGMATFAAPPTGGTASQPEAEPPPPPEPSMLEPVGVQDLIVVRSRHLGYRLAELSRIENIAPGETRDRHHTVETESSSSFFEEVDHEEETTDSLATTTRDELRSEIDTRNSRELQLTGTVRTSYRGPVTVEAEASVEFGQQSEVSTTTTSAHAVDVVDEATTKVRDRILRRTEHRFRRLVAERNRHAFTNDDDTGRVAQYYWLEKVQRAALFNYGRRIMYEFVVPEPASYLRALSKVAPEVPSAVLPPPTTYYNDLLAMPLADLDGEYASGELARHFTLTVDEAPVSTWLDTPISATLTGKPDEIYTSVSADVVIPSGFRGEHLRITVQTSSEDKNILPHLTLAMADVTLHVQARTLDNEVTAARFRQHPQPSQGMAFGDTRVLLADASLAGDPLSEGGHKVQLILENLTLYAVTVSVLLVPTDAAVDAWRRSLLAAVVVDYRRQYETFAAQALAAVPNGPTLLENLSDAQAAELRTIERDEIKRAALAVIRNADPEGPDPIQQGEPQVAQWFREQRELTDEILFLEQAFEWEHMNVVLYGYHWSDPGDRSLQVFGVRGGDRPFREFLKAGAARVQLPVRPGFGKFVDDYMMTGEPWSGGPTPQIGSEGYLDVIAEQSAQLGAPAHEVPVTEKVPGGKQRSVYWDVVTPTDLVLLKVWDDGAGPPLERMRPPAAGTFVVAVGTPSVDPLAKWTSDTGAVPDDPAT